MSPTSGRVALVTGGTRGIGHGIARELAADGATVYLTGRTGVQEAAEKVSTAGSTVIGIECDHSSDESVAKLFAQIGREAGRLDVLVNCAATVPDDKDVYAANFQPFWQSDPSVWDTWCEVGLRSHYVAAMHAARLMVTRGSGLIVNVSSAAAAYYFGCVAYGVGKAALDRFTTDAAIELRGDGVAVVSIWPGAVRTEKTRALEKAGMANLNDAESPEFAGRAVVALANDPNILTKSGSAHYVAALACDYGFTEIDGSQPPLPTYGGMLQAPG